MVRRASLLIAVVFMASACGGGVTGVPVPTPTPTPPGGGTGTVIGTGTVGPTALPGAAPPPGSTRPARTAAIGRPLYVPDQLVVRPRPGADTASTSSVHSQIGATVLRTIDKLNLQVVRLAPGVAAAAAITAYRASGLFDYVEQDGYAYATATPTDPQYGLQSWHYGQIGLPTAWNTTTGGPVIVAVIDTGIRPAHPDLTGLTVTGFDFITNPANGDGNGRDSDPTDPGCPDIDPTDPSHGTHVAGTIAALTNNGVNGAGVNWGGASGIKIMALRVLGEVTPYSNPLNCGVGTYADILDAIMYAADHGAKVINMSLGGGASTLLDAAIAYARGLGVTIVVAAGNGGCGPISYPGSNPNVIAVGATANTSPATRASYSNCGAELDVVAPGGDGSSFVWSTTWAASGPFAGNVFAGFQGTSMATPHVAGLVALMISRGITGPANIQNVLQTTATDLAPAGFDTSTGWGLVNAAAAVGAAPTGSKVCAFSGVIVSPTITRQSDIVRVADSGAFTITNAQSGTKSVFIWQDIDNSGTVNTGDGYGRTNNVSIFPGQTTPSIGVTVQTYGTGVLAGAPPLSVPGGAICP